MAKSSAAPAQKYSATPWFADDKIESDFRDASGELIGSFYETNEGGEAQAIANTEFVLKAVAAHQALYEALSALLPAVDRMVDSFGEGHPSYEYLVNASNAGHAALALADAVQGEK